MRRLLHALALLLGSAAALFAADAPVKTSARPNILLICVDDLKPLLGCYGTPLVQTPNLDALSARGVRFDAAYCNQAVCSPSRNALLTGLRSTTIGIYDLTTNFRQAVPDAVTLPQHFRANGYHTAALGKVYHVGSGNHDDPSSWSEPTWVPKLPLFAQPENRERLLARLKFRPKEAPAGAQRPRIPATECADVPDTAYADGQIADEAIRRLEAARTQPDTPFFLAVGFIKPHLPFCAPQKYWDLYRRDQFHLPAWQKAPIGAPEYAPNNFSELRAYSDIPNVGPLTEAQSLELIHGYHAAVSYVDAQIGRLLAAFDRLRLADNTVVVLWGDHGWHLGDHGMWCKHTNYEEANRIPFFVTAPRLTQAGSVARGLVESVDLYPTLCELAGLPVPAGLDGASFVPMLRDPAHAAGKSAIFHAYTRQPAGLGFLVGRAVRTDRYRLVEWKKPGAAAETAQLELYDYREDPAETRNLATARPDIVAQLLALLRSQPEARDFLGDQGRRALADEG